MEFADLVFGMKTSEKVHFLWVGSWPVCIHSWILYNNKNTWRPLGSSKGDLMKKITILLSKVLNASLGKVKKTASLTMASLLLFSATSFAGPISSLYVFGDSLSDSGAFTHLAPAVCPPEPYAGCRFSNGPVWAELLAADLGVSADSAYGGGTNYAIGGQRTEQVLGFQIPTFLASTAGEADTDALYVIWAGGNDFLQNDPVGTYSPFDAADNIIASILTLSAAGATDFLIPNLPIAESWAFEFNAALADGLDGLERDLNITQFDAFSQFLDMTLNPDDYGFTNVLEPCFNGVSACADPDEYLLWDPVHPTAAAHRIIADAALAALPVSVSAPATLVIFSFGLLALLRTRRQNLV
ncbi:MAG: phospholipase/lecithinase/hemolysin [Alphaproteobacteria bacterium]|jgi:phospholipase/lecithinase/hemolysin